MLLLYPLIRFSLPRRQPKVSILFQVLDRRLTSIIINFVSLSLIVSVFLVSYGDVTDMLAPNRAVYNCGGKADWDVVLDRPLRFSLMPAWSLLTALFLLSWRAAILGRLESRRRAA